VTTAGGIEEDFIKCLAPTFLGDFRLPGKELRKKGLNRIGNLIAPNNNYIKFEEWLMPLLDQLLEEQKTKVGQGGGGAGKGGATGGGHYWNFCMYSASLQFGTKEKLKCSYVNIYYDSAVQSSTVQISSLSFNT